MDEARVRFPASASVLISSRSSVGRSSASHAEGPGFDPQRELLSDLREVGGSIPPFSNVPARETGELAQMVERPLSIGRCYSSEVELSAAVRMVGGSIPPDT